MDVFSTWSKSNATEAEKGKRNAVFFKRRGQSVTFSFEQCINVEPYLSIKDLLCMFQTSVRLLHPVVKPSLIKTSLRRVTSAFTICVIHHHAFSVTHRIIIKRTQMSADIYDQIIHWCVLPSGPRAQCYVYVNQLWV